MSTMRPRYTHQMPWVGTLTQHTKIEAFAEERGISKAHVVRQAIDAFFNLVDGEEPRRSSGERLRSDVEAVIDDASSKG